MRWLRVSNDWAPFTRRAAECLVVFLDPRQQMLLIQGSTVDNKRERRVVSPRIDVPVTGGTRQNPEM